jgi:hypothetical protein
MTLIDKACYERGCACYDSRVDRDGVEVVQREWVGLTDEEMLEIWEDRGWYVTMFKAIEDKLKEKNT